MTVRYAEICDIGLKASENQDAVFCASGDEKGLFVVADGMGGHKNGAFASGVLKEMFSTWWDQNRDSTVKLDGRSACPDRIRDVIKNANRRILSSSPEGSICGSTVVALWIEGDSYTVFSCGDSRCYMITKKLFGFDMRCLTSDDVWENNPNNVKGLTDAQVRQHKNHGKLLRAVGTENEFVCSVRGDVLPEKSLFLLCSDGVYKYAGEEELYREVKKAWGKETDLKTCVQAVKNLVYRNGAPDIMSVILVSVGQ